MTTQGFEGQTPSDRSQRTSGKADDAMASVAREYNDPKTNPQQRQGDLAALNQTLQQTGVIPGLTITDMQGTNPGDPKAPENVTMHTNDPTTEGTIQGQPAYDPNTHTLKFDRSPVLLGTPKDQPTEHVAVNMLSGQETVTVPGDNGTTRTTTREYVGAPDPTTVVGRDGHVVQTEATDKNGGLTVTQYNYDNSGRLTSFTPQGGQETKLPDGSTVDQKTGVLFATSLDGTKTMVTPQGRTFTTDQAGKTSYTVKPGDTLWDVSRDLAKVQGNLTPSDSNIQGTVNQIGHAGDKHDPNAIQAGETINFGVGTQTDTTGQADPTAKNDNLDLRGAKPSDAPVPPPPPGDAPQNGLPDGIHLPQGLPGLTSTDVKTTVVQGQDVTVTTNNGDTIQFTNGKDDSLKYTVAGGKTFDFHKNDDGGWTMMEAGAGHQVLSINALRIDKGVVRFSEKNPFAADDHMMVTKDGGIVEEPLH